MQLIFGSDENGIAHDINDPALSIDRTGLFTDAGVLYGILNVWTIEGRLIASSQATVSTEIDALELGYSKNVERFALKLDSGDDSSHVIVASETLDGIRVSKPPYYPVGRGAEYSTYRNYAVQVTATVLVKSNAAEAEIVSFQETVTYTGSGTRDVIMTPLIGTPVRIRTATQTPQFIVQSGQVVSLTRPIDVTRLSPPLFAAYLLEDKTVIELGSAQTFFIGGARRQTQYPARWRYEMAHVQRVTVQRPRPRRLTAEGL